MEFIEETKLPFDKIEELLKIYSDMERILQYDGKFKSFEERLLELELFYDGKIEGLEKQISELKKTESKKIETTERKIEELKDVLLKRILESEEKNENMSMNLERDISKVIFENKAQLSKVRKHLNI